MSGSKTLDALRLMYGTLVGKAKEFLGRLLRLAGACILRFPALSEKIRPYEEPRGRFWKKIKQIMFDAGSWGLHDRTFSRIRLEGFDLLFSNGPLADRRGIGRVCREQFKHLSDVSGEPVETVLAGDPAGTVVHFYTSVHWCPDVLPPNTVVMIHDVIPLLFPKQFPARIFSEWKYRYKRIVAQARHVVTISHSSADEISRLLDVPREKISVVYNGVTQLPVDATMADVQLPERPYVVFLGSDDRHKNLGIVLKALTLPELAGVDLVLIGDNKTTSCMGQVKALKLGARVHFMGKLSDGQIGHVLTRGKGLVFPSLYEGFGLPPMEAALLGIPAICSKRPAMDEMLEGATIFVEPDDEQGWATAIHQLVYVPEVEAKIAQAARSRVSGFTWDASTQQLLDVLAPLAK